MEKMSVVNLMVLGFLLEKPMSAYEMANLLDDRILGRLMKISAPAVYKNVKKLHQGGYLSVEVVREGEMPEKKVYSVTDKGKDYFFTLMQHYSNKFSEYYFEFNAVLLNIDKVDKQAGLEMLTALQTHFKTVQTWIIAHEREAREKRIFFTGRALVKQARMVVTTLVEWIEEVIEEYRQFDEQPSMVQHMLDHHEGFTPFDDDK